MDDGKGMQKKWRRVELSGFVVSNKRLRLVLPLHAQKFVRKFPLNK